MKIRVLCTDTIVVMSALIFQLCKHNCCPSIAKSLRISHVRYLRSIVNVDRLIVNHVTFISLLFRSLVLTQTQTRRL